MTTANNASRFCWAYEGTPESAGIVNVGDTTYVFGYYDLTHEKWIIESPENPVEPYYINSSREAQLTKLDTMFKTLSHEYVPRSPQFLARFLKSAVTGTPITIGVLDTGKTTPITIRHEESGGTVETLQQWVGCYTIGITIDAMINEALKVEEKFAYCFMEDHDDRSHLTTAPILGDSCDVTGVYNGTPAFTWNSTARPEVIRVTLGQDQNFQRVHDPVNDKDTINCYTYKPPEMLVYAVLKVNTIWDDYFDREARTAVLTLTKNDGSTTIIITITNCLVTKITRTGKRDEGHYEVVAHITGEAISATANNCNTNFATNYKAGV